MRWYLYRLAKIKPLLLALLLAAVLLLLIKGCRQEGLPDVNVPAGGAAPSSVYFTLVPEDYQLPARLTVYKYKNKEMSQADVEKLAEILEIRGKCFYNDETCEYTVNANGKILLAEQHTGMWTYRDIGRQYSVDTMTCSIPSDDEVVNLAKDYLAQVGISAEEFSSVTLGTTTENNRVIGKTVYFYQQVDGYEINGAAKLAVHIGHQGQLEGITKGYQEIERHKTCRLKTLNQAMRELEAGEVYYQTAAESVLGQATIYDVRLVYYQEPSNASENRYLQPMYLFTGDVETEEGTQSLSALVPAVKGVGLKVNGAVEEI